MNGRQVGSNDKGHPLWKMIGHGTGFVTVEGAHLSHGDIGGERCMERVVNGRVGRLPPVVCVVVRQGGEQCLGGGVEGVGLHEA